MIKFFQRIRQNILFENKGSKYLLYAIGEILLVVIGILIALEVNNWNEARKSRIVEIELLKTIKIDLDRTLDDVTADYKNYLKSQESGNKFKLFILGEDLPEDSIIHHFNILNLDQHFFPNSIGYNVLKSSNMNIISNDSLRMMITELYEVGFPRVKEFDESNPRWDIGALLQPYYKKHFYLTDEILENQSSYVGYQRYKLKLRSIEKIRNDDEFQIDLQESFAMRNRKIGLNRFTIRKIEDALIEIENEVNRLNGAG
jgi:hypothetical protein